METNQEIGLLSELEQMETNLSNNGQILATYYKSLIEAGVPEQLAYDLVKQWHELYWNRIINLSK